MPKEPKSSFFSGAAILAAGIVVVKIIGAIYKIPIVNVLGTGYADFSNAYYIYALLLTISTAGLPVALSKMVAAANARQEYHQTQKIFRVSMSVFVLLGLLSFLVMFFFADKLAELYVTEERIDMEEGAEIEPGVSLGDRYPAYLNYAMSECLVSYTQMNIKADSIPEIIQEFMEADGLVAEDNEYNSANVIKWIRYGQTVNAQLAYENYPVEWKKMEQQIISLNFTTSYSLTSILLGLINSFSAIEAAENPFIKLHNDLIEAIASMGYIRCTKEKDMNNGLSFAYEFCTPGILLVPFNELYYNEDNYVNQFVPELNDALRYYQNTEFDQKVGWSRVLKLIDIVPSAFTNPMRENMFNMEPEQGVK